MKVPFVHTVIHEISTMHGKCSASMLQKIMQHGKQFTVTVESRAGKSDEG